MCNKIKKQKLPIEVLESQRRADLCKSALCKTIDALGASIFGPLWFGCDFFGKIYSSAKETYYDDFMFGMWSEIAKHGKDKELESLSVKVQREDFAAYLANILDAVFFSKSNKARMILGQIAAKYLYSDMLDYEDLLLVIALKETYDVELNKFIEFANKEEDGHSHNLQAGFVCVYDYDLHSRIFIDKMINLNIFGGDLAGNRFFNDGEFPIRYVKTSVSNRLLEYLNNINSEGKVASDE